MDVEIPKHSSSTVGEDIMSKQLKSSRSKAEGFVTALRKGSE